MKKINIILMSVFTIVLSTVLASCSLKKIEASFLVEEVAISLDETINLENYVSVQGVDLDDVNYLVSDSSILNVEGSILSANSVGISYVYVTYDNNNLASMKVVVKQRFSTPTNITVSESGVLSWDVVSGIYLNSTEITYANSYYVVGEYYSVDENGQLAEDGVEFEQVLNTTSLQLDEGAYMLSITALGVDYFDDSKPTDDIVIYVGFMQQLTKADFSWDGEVLTWSAVSGASYQVVFDGVLLDEQETTSRDLSSYLDASDAGSHTVSVIVYDLQNDKFPMQSESVEIIKLETPQVLYVDGEIEVTWADGVKEYVITATQTDVQDAQSYTYSLTDKSTTSFEGLEAGVYSISVVANNDGSDSKTFYYHSDTLNFGKIYKLDTPTITGDGNNELDGNILKATISSLQVPVSTSLEIFGATFESDSGIEANQTQTSVNIVISSSGKYQISVKQVSTVSTYTSGEDTIYVINSDVSEEVSVQKLSAFSSEVTHAYQSDVSTFTFDAVPNATTYKLYYYNGTEYVEVSEDYYSYQILDSVKITFTKKIEDIFTSSEGKYDFKVVAMTDNDLLTINSSTQKVLKTMEAPTTVESGNSTSLIYSWGEVEGATSYKILVYTVNSTQFAQEVIDLDSLTPEEYIVKTNSLTLSAEGYYVVKVFAIPEDENEYITSNEVFLQERFYIQKQLELGDVQFGYNEDYIYNYTDTSGYFLQITNTYQVTSYQISVGGSVLTLQTAQTSSADQSIFLLPTSFESGTVTISVVGNNDDSTIYLATSAYELQIIRLAGVTFDDLTIDDYLPNQTITLEFSDGVRQISIYSPESKDSVNVSKTVSENAVFSISKTDEYDYYNFSLQFVLYGSTYDSISKTYEISNNVVYLDSETSTIEFQRLDNPTSFQYYNGNLTFEHTNITSVINATGAYVLELTCTTPNGSTSISVRFGYSVTTVVYDNEEIDLDYTSLYLTTSGTTVTIDLEKLLEDLQSSVLADIYSQIINIEFSVYAYQTRMVSGVSYAELSSPYATISGTTTGETTLEVQTMEGTSLTLETSGSSYMLTWEEVNSSYATYTTYKIYNYSTGQLVGSVTGNTFYTLSSITSGTTYYVIATNPYYLDSARSNLVEVNQLSRISQITLNNGQISFTITTAESSFVTEVQVVVTGTTNTSFSVTTNSFEIPSAGTYTFTVIGQSINEYSLDGETLEKIVYYLDSNSTTFYIMDMSDIAPTDKTLTVDNSIISWGTFGENVGTFSSLEYVIMFKDSTGYVETYTTTSTSINWTSDDELRTLLDNLAEGDVTISVSAHLNSYSVSTNGTIYFATATTLLNDSSEYNHFVYTYYYTKKLTAPVVESVDFVNNSNTEYTQTPDIEITFSGNYGTGGQFVVYREGDLGTLLEVEVEYVGQNNGVYIYKFTLTASEYANYALENGELSFSIYALNSGTDNNNAIPSARGEVVFVRPANLTSVSFSTTNGYTNDEVVIQFEEEYAEQYLGGVILMITYTFEGDTITDYEYIEVSSIGDVSGLTYSLEDFINNTYTSSGGTITLSAFVNYYANDNTKTYILPSISSVTSGIYTVLEPLTQEEIVSNEYGFTITNVNDSSAIYVVTVKETSQTFEISSSDDFAFTVPDDWSNGTYTLSIEAKQANTNTTNYLNSALIGNLSFGLDRATAVTEVNLVRGDDYTLSLSWAEAETGAIYIIKVYDYNSGTLGDLIYTSSELTREASSGTITYTLKELFGDDYSEFEGIDTTQDNQIVIQIITITEGKQLSKGYSFNVTIKANTTTSSDFNISENGLITFAKESDSQNSYLYRFVSGSTYTEWTTLGSYFDTSAIDASEADVAFNLEILVLGNVGASSGSTQSTEDGNIIFDSAVYSTTSISRTFYKVADIINISYQEDVSEGIVFNLYQTVNVQVLAGTNENSLYNGEVVAFDLNWLGLDSNDLESYRYYINLMQVVSGLRSANYIVEGDSVTLYFWIYRTTYNEGMTYVTSNYRTFSFSFNLDVDYEDFIKLASITSDDEEYKYVNDYEEDYVNTYVIFKNTDVEDTIETVGITVKITTTIDETTYSFFKFADKETLTSFGDKFKEDYFVINLLDLFDEDDISNLSGTFTLEFSKTAILNGSTYSVSDWLSSEIKDGMTKEFSVTRLTGPTALNISYGNMSWDIGDESAEFYYVYFYSDIENENYTKYKTTSTTFAGEKIAGLGSSYYVAVQCINSDAYVLSSIQVFKSDSDGDPIKVYRNQFSTDLVLEGGALKINWTTIESDTLNTEDFFALLTTTSISAANVVSLLTTTTFTVPFTFTLSDLVNGTLYVNLRFTATSGNSVGVYQTFRVSASTLLASLYDFADEQGYGSTTLSTRLQTLLSATTDGTSQTLIGSLINLLDEGSYGVANKNVLFDDIFENLQQGTYRLEYCLTEGSNTFNSGWYEYKNSEGENEIYVNGQPNISFTITEDSSSKAINVFKLIIQKSTIQTSSTEYEIAQNYVLKLGDDAYSISLSTGSLIKLGDEGGTAVSVYECDANGNIVSGTGSYIMFYINYNSGNSLLGRYGDGLDDLGAQSLQVYAVGNEYSFSSKSEVYSITFLSFGNFSVVEGVFTWTTQQSMPTSVIYSLTNNNNQTEVYVYASDDDGETGTFDSSELSSGTYNIQFVIKGQIRQNTIYVDSSIYTAQNVTKLSTPSLSNVTGYLQIQSNNNLDDIYNDNGKYNFKVTHNQADDVSVTLIDTNSTILYEVGTTGLTASDDEYYIFKSAEELATEFEVTQLGSTAELTTVQDTDEAYYYLEYIKCVDTSTGEIVNEGNSNSNIALTSSTATINAGMMDVVENIRVEDSVLVWDAVNTRTENNTTLTIEEDVQVVYKLTIVRYIESYSTSNGATTQTQVGDSIIEYTAQTYFDFANIAEDDYVDSIATYIKVTIQAMALYVANTYSGTDRVSLIEGGFAYGQVQYANSERYVLMSNGTTYDGISRLDPIDDDSLQVVDGSLTWTYTVVSYINTSTFWNYYSFIVTDDEGNEIQGGLSVAIQDESTNTFAITFTPYDGQMKSGTYKVNVYVTQGENSTASRVIKSFARSLEITKLATITDNDFTIETDSQTESLVININNANYEVVCTIITSAGEQEVTFTQSKNKLYIFNEEPTSVDYGDDYVGYIVIGNDDSVQISFKVKSEGAIYSDESQTFVLYRSDWDDESEIVWDEENQQFTWEYNYYSLSQATSARMIEESGEYGETVTLDISSIFEVIEWGESVSKISIDGITYQIDTANIVSPVFIVEANYGGEIRTYTTSEKYFTPTVTGSVSITVRIKINDNNLLSASLESETQTFNLFSSGDGTSTNPYTITSEEEFENIQYRMTKDDVLTTYVNINGNTVTEDSQFYFSLSTDLSFEFSGILLSGEFSGVLYGNNHSIEFTSTGVSELTNTVTIDATDNKVPATSSSNALTFSRGSAIFDTFTASATVSDLSIGANFGSSESSIYVYFNSLFAGLVISNNGVIENVSLTSFSAMFVGILSTGTRATMVYSGIASINNTGAQIINCSAECSIGVSDGGTAQLIFVSGIAYTNYGSISSCTSGISGQSISVVCQAGQDAIQVAGIAITSAYSGSIRNCTNNYNLSVEAGSSSNSITGYIAGIVCYGKGTVTGNTNNGTIITTYVNNITTGEITATTA